MAFQSDWEKITDQQLRPWTFDEETNDVIDHAYQSMNVGFKNTAPMDKTSAISQLDRKPAAFIALEHRRRLLAETGKMTALVSRMKIATPVQQQQQQPTKDKRPTTTSSARELLLKTNNLLSMLDSKSSSRSGTARASSSGSGGGSSSSRHLLESIKYEARKGPATINMSSSEYERFSQRMDSLASSSNNNNNTHDNPDGLSQQETAASLERPMTTSSVVIDADIDQDGSHSHMDANAANAEETTTTGLGDRMNVASLDESSTDEVNVINNNNNIDDINNSSSGVNNSNSSPTKSTQLPRIQDHPSTRPSTVSGGGGYTLESVTGGLFKDTTSPQKQPPLLSALLAPAQGLGSPPSARRVQGSDGGGSVSGGGGSVSAGGRRTNSDWLKVEGSGGLSTGGAIGANHGTNHRVSTAAMSGAMLAMPAPAASSLSDGSGSARLTHISREGAFTLFGGNDGSNHDPLSTLHHPESSSSSGLLRASPSAAAASSSSLSPSSSRMTRLSSNTPPLLTRPNTTSSASTTSLTLKQGNDRTFSHKRIKELKALKELTMTQSGSFGLNVHPEVSQECLEENQRMRLVTQKCVADCIERNQTDSTGSLLITPAYMDTIGPKKFYLSTIHETIDNNEQFKHAVKNADVSKGVKMDPIRVWIENAARQKSPMFVSGGGFKI